MQFRRVCDFVCNRWSRRLLYDERVGLKRSCIGFTNRFEGNNIFIQGGCYVNFVTENWYSLLQGEYEIKRNQYSLVDFIQKFKKKISYYLGILY